MISPEFQLGASKKKVGVISDPVRFNKAMIRFDAANAQDPNAKLYNGVEYPKELLYAEQMTTWLNKLAPNASEALQLAARCQHIRRWAIPRSDYPMGRNGYQKWRTRLAKFHAETAADILQAVGYDEDIIHRVQTLLQKKRLKLDHEVQLLEDIICLVFLEYYFVDFAREHDEEKLINIIRKTWRKMSPQGHKAALGLDFPSDLRQVVEKAVAQT